MRIHQHRPRNRQKLFLSFGNVGAFLRENCIVPVRKRENKFMDSRRFRRRDNLFLCRVFPAVSNVFINQCNVLNFEPAKLGIYL